MSGAASAAVLVGDIGGTNARFALLEDDAPVALARLTVSEFPDARSALAEVLARARRPVCAALLAVAGPVRGGRAHLTNGAWTFDAGALERALDLGRVELLNDFAAQALALPALAADDLVHLAGPATADDEAAPRAVLGPGTGLGVGALLPDGTPLVGEGGHVTLPARTPREWQVLQALSERYGHVSAERVLSGPGLAALHGVLAAEQGGDACPSAEAVSAAARAGEAVAQEALALFFGFLGTVAGDVALTLGARAGVFLAGGILPQLQDRLPDSRLVEAFLAKGRFRDYLASVPVHLVVQRDPALVGLVHRARHLLQESRRT